MFCIKLLNVNSKELRIERFRNPPVSHQYQPLAISSELSPNNQLLNFVLPVGLEPTPLSGENFEFSVAAKLHHGSLNMRRY